MEEKLNGILQYLHYHPYSSRNEIMEGTRTGFSIATIKRLIASAIEKELITTHGQGRAIRYNITPQALLLMTFDLDTYFASEVDERTIQQNFNFNLITELLPQIRLFNNDESQHLHSLQDTFRQHSNNMSASAFKKEMERLGIDLSWKSSQIEGNTYSLLETERLLTERIEAKGKSREEAVMLLNHKEALHFILQHPDYLHPLTVSRIEDIHRILVQDMNVDSGIRNRRVGIIGTNYRPLDNEFQIKEAMHDSCNLINNCTDVFEKALLALALISYIQPFTDGNKRTARIVSNAILIANHYCPISFRSVDSMDYKKAMLIFYEQNNIYAFKQIFINQFEFAVKTYF